MYAYNWKRHLEFVATLMTEAEAREDLARANVESAVLSLLTLAETLAFKAGMKECAGAIREAWMVCQTSKELTS